MEKVPAPAEKQCEACQIVKPIDQFYRTKNGRDGHMKKCKECQRSQQAENARQEAIRAEERRQAYEEERQARQKSQKMVESQRAYLAKLVEEGNVHRQEQAAFLEAWYAEQPARACIACRQEKAATEFGYSELMAQENGYWVPARLHQRCKPCHELMRASRPQQNIPCVLCKQPIGTALGYIDGYHLFGGGTRINLCCSSCRAAFQDLPRGKQRFYISIRVNLAFPSSQVIYAEVDPLTQEKRYIGRTGHPTRRHNEHKRNIRADRPLYISYDNEKDQYTETPWYSRANWMYDLAQQGLSPKQQILLDVQPAAYVVEYETRHILHAIQQGWPILNLETQRSSTERVRASTLDFLHAPFADLVEDGWFTRDGIEAFIRAGYVQ